jgi:hypothetical protein
MHLYGSSVRAQLSFATSFSNRLGASCKCVTASVNQAALHQHFPELRIFVCGRDRHHGHRLAQFGAAAVVREAVEASLQLGGLVLTSVGANAKDAPHVNTQFLQGGYAGLEVIAGAES